MFALIPVAGIAAILLLRKLNRNTPLGSTRPPPLPPPVPPVPAIPDGPGTYRVSGVRKADRKDVTVMVQAASAGNARAKAEIDGIVVTLVEKAS
jgi:hypothetical protein